MMSDGHDTMPTPTRRSALPPTARTARTPPATSAAPAPSAPPATDDLRWDAVLARDRSRDGAFVFGVVTTGVFCRPSCPARRPNRSHVRFYPTPADAAGAGLRPCLRCHPLAGPDSGQTDPIGRVCAHIHAHLDEPLGLDVLARAAGWSRFHLQRTFTSAVGITPARYVEACRLRAFRTSLKAGASVTAATYEAGFGSSSRVYERVDARLGMTPGAYRDGGRGLHISHVTVRTPLGLLMIGATDRGVCAVQFGPSRTALLDALRQEFPRATFVRGGTAHPEGLRAWAASLRAHLADARQPVSVPLDVRATAFQMRVWQHLQTIPPGTVRTYADVARRIGRPGSARAVARACATNPVALLIPCHRVIRGDGGLAGYRWGLDRKARLLEAERGARTNEPRQG